MYNWIYRNILNKIDAERCHDIGLKVLKNRFLTKMLSGKVPVDDRLNVVIGGVKFNNPLGMAAGFDKNGIVFHNLMRLGFGHVEVGTITLDEREGNSKPRLWRVRDGLVNRMGLPGCGLLKVFDNISCRRYIGGVIGANISPINSDHLSDFTAIERLYKTLRTVTDYITVNISCPNVEKNIDQDIKNVIQVLSSWRYVPNGVPIFVKLAPNLEENTLKRHLDLLMEYELDGVVLGNTLPTKVDGLNAGVSGPRLIEHGINNVSTAFQHTEGKLHIVGVGGVENSLDALHYIRSGASLVQMYTGFVNYGPRTPANILNGMLDDLGDKNVKDIRGTWA